MSTAAPVKKVHIWTMQMGRWRQAKAEDIHVLDITAKTGVPAFAPEFRQVMRYKANEIDKIEYTRLYDERMERSLRQLPHEWQKLKTHERVALACYCRPDQFCHRHLFSEMMKNYLTNEGVEVVMEGELLPPPPAPVATEEDAA